MPFENESVWKEQVDEALVLFIQSIIISPENGNPINVTIRKPDEDFKTEDYPRITVYNIFDQPNNMRRSGMYNNDDILISKDLERYKGFMDAPALTYDLFYQIDFWSVLQSHMNDMTRQWLGKIHSRYFNLDVKDMSGKDRNSFVLQQGNLQKADLLNGSERIFRSFITYAVWVELDEAKPYEIPLVKDFIVQRKG
jgi:hypothetical protein